MNRRKKGIQILTARIKKANAKLSSHSKSKYVSKADRVNVDTGTTNNDSAVTETQP